ncbi:hypothetical protein A6J66_011970 [Yersinia enterocolitica]|nr:hypothetical protein A6J66_011970 [Yersinia enterocolitica]
MQYKKPENFTHFGAKSNLKRRFLCASFGMSTVFFVYRRFQREIITHLTRLTPLREIYPSYLKPQGCWLRALTRIIYLSKFIVISLLAAYLKPQSLWV